MTGCVVCITGKVVNWLCKKQGGVTLSTLEAEFVAASQAARALLGSDELLKELGMHVDTLMVMRMDSQSANALVESESSSMTAKHIDVRIKFVKESLKRGIVQPEYKPPSQILADNFTKVPKAPDLEEKKNSWDLSS